jgi:hypothetical protein
LQLHRSVWAVLAALAVACSCAAAAFGEPFSAAAPDSASAPDAVATPADAATPAVSMACRNSYSYAGMATRYGAHGIGAAVTALSAPRVLQGHVGAWVGVGGPGLGPSGEDEWIQVGLSAFPGSDSRLYYEVKQPGLDARYFELRTQIAPGERHRVAVLEVYSQPNVWRVWVDGVAASTAYYLPGSHNRWQPQAMAESWNDGQSICNGFNYDFSRVSIAAAPGGGWHRVKVADVYSDPGYTMRWRALASFTATTSA